MPPEPFDWRAYSHDRGVTEMRAWIAMQQATGNRYPHGVTVTSPASLDRLCADEAMHGVIRGVIDDLSNNTDRKAAQ